MDYIILGDRKGTENEVHYKLTLKGLLRGEIVEIKFDVYAEKSEDVMKLIKEYFESTYRGFSVHFS